MPDPVTIATTMSLTDFLLGIAGNLIAKHADPTVNSLASKIYERLSSGGMSLPPNHDVERGCRTALSQALTMLAQAIEFHVQRPKTWLEGLRNSRDEHGNWKPLLSRMQTPEGIWFDEFIREIRSDEALQTFRIPVGDASSLNEAMRNRPNDTQAELFRKGLVDWTERRVQKGSPPACFLEFIGDRQSPDPQVPRGIGWPMKPDTPGVRVSLFQVWSLFLQDYLKKNEEVFRILTAEWLSSIDSRLKAGLLSRDELIAAINEPLGELRDELIELHDDVSRLLGKIDGLSVGISELLPLVIAFRAEMGQGFEALVRELAEQHNLLVKVKDDTAATREETRAIRDGVDRIERNIGLHVGRSSRHVEPPPPPPCNLPERAVHHYGRIKQKNALIRALRERDNVAVIGPPGLGKTSLAAEALHEVIGESLAASPFPDGVVLLDLYASHADRTTVFAELANKLAGDAFMDDAQDQRVRARAACLHKRILVVLEGGEEADGRDERRLTLNELFDKRDGVLAPENRWLLMTRTSSQGVMCRVQIDVNEKLSPSDAEKLFDRLTKKRVTGETRTNLLECLDGHPLALTWAGKLLAMGTEDASVLVAEWRADPTLTLHDPDESKRDHTLRWLFDRSVRGLAETAQRILEAAGLLGRLPFPVKAIEAALDPNHLSRLLKKLTGLMPDHSDAKLDLPELPNLSSEQIRAGLSQLADRGLLRTITGREGVREFTHVLAYQFARKEEDSDAGLLVGLGRWLHQELSVAVKTGPAASREITDLLQHSAALLRTDQKKLLWLPLANFLLYDGRDRLLSLGRLDWTNAALQAVLAWLDRLSAKERDESTWLRERSVCFNKLGDLATAQGNLPEAQRLFGESLRIRQRLAESDTANAEWQRDLSVSFEKLAQVSNANGHVEEAIQYQQKALEISTRLASSNPTSAELRRTVWVHHFQMARLMSTDDETATSHLKAVYDILAEMVAVGLFVSPQDMELFEQLHSLFEP